MSAWSDPGFTAIAALIERETGLTWPVGRQDAAEAAMRRAMQRARVKALPQYLELIRTEPVAREELIAELTIGETYFFRDSNQFAALRETILPAIAATAEPGRELRAWSAGCASGEEPYSVAVLLNELGLKDRARVVGTDIARHRLAAARQARYTKWSLRGVETAVVRRWFREEGRHFHLEPAVREAVEFRYLNLAEDRYPSLSSGIWGMDLILCRNVLIYFDRDTVARVAARLVTSLADDGWLMLGASDPPIAEYVDCDVVVVGGGIAYRRAGAGARARGSASVPGAGDGIRLATVDRSALLAFEALDEPAGEAAVAGRDAGPAAVPTAERQPAHGDAPGVAERAAPSGRAADSQAGDVAAAASDAASRRPAGAAGGDEPGLAAAAAYATRDYEAAARLSAAAIAGGSDGERTWVLRVRALANLGRTGEASQACHAALDRHSGSAELAYLLAVLLLEAGRPADAVAAARRALYLDRGFVVAQLALADAAARAGDGATARRALRNASRLLEAEPPETPVPGSDGESAGRLAEIVRMRVRLLAAA
jgi:chemotaxis protein methyltransferase CheR